MIGEFMESSFDLSAINLCNMLGVLLLGVLFFSNIWRLRNRNAENVSLLLLMFFAFSNCLVDPVVYAVDGKSGFWNHVVSVVGNSWLFFAQVSSAVAWVHFFSRHLNGRLSKVQYLIVTSVELISVAVLVINLFVPIAFDVTDANVYVRKPGFFVFVFFNYALLLDSIVIYYFSRTRGGMMKFFPVWLFASPVIIGGVVQSLFYGVSVTAVCLAISVAGVLAGLQNEMIYRDSLTGLFNRYYLDYFLKNFVENRKQEISGIMLDLNSFKSINDQFGHTVGDKALIDAAGIIRMVVGDMGAVIRYAGDEFIVLLNSTDQRIVKTCESEIRAFFEKFNKTSGAPYHLAVSIGSCKMDHESFSVDEFINEIDKRMYEDKRAYYANNIEADRRNR